MTTEHGKVSALKISSLLAFVTLVGIIAVTGAFPWSLARGSSLALPRVTSVEQITHDGVSKTNLLSDDSNLYVTEWPAARHVIAKVSLQRSDRSLVSSPFSNLQALDLSPDHTKLLVSPIQGGSLDHEFWTLPVASGSPERVGTLTGRDAAWSVDGQHLAFGKGSVLYVASATGTQVRELFTANGSVFAPRFSPDGQRIRFTVGDVAQNKTSLGRLAVTDQTRMPCSPIGNTAPRHAAAAGRPTAATTFSRRLRVLRPPSPRCGHYRIPGGILTPVRRPWFH